MRACDDGSSFLWQAYTTKRNKPRGEAAHRSKVTFTLHPNFYELTVTPPCGTECIKIIMFLPWAPMWRDRISPFFQSRKKKCVMSFYVSIYALRSPCGARRLMVKSLATNKIQRLNRPQLYFLSTSFPPPLGKIKPCQGYIPFWVYMSNKSSINF